MTFISQPMSGFWAPNDRQVNQTEAIMADASRRPIFVHCLHGEDRTGLIVGLHRVFHEGWDPAKAYQEMLDNKIDAFSKAFQALTISCARCHDHKIDPVLQSEYYAIGGIFMSSRWLTNTVDLPERSQSFRSDLTEIKSHLRPLLAGIWREDLARLSVESLRQKQKDVANKDPEQVREIFDFMLTGRGKAAPARAGAPA